MSKLGQTLRNACNPGGEVAVTEVRDVSVLPQDLPKNKLIQEKELKGNGWV